MAIMNFAENSPDVCGNSDYTSTSTSVTLRAGSAVGNRISVSIPIVDDNSVEQLTEDFMVTKSSANPDVMFPAGNSAICRITDNDSKYKLLELAMCSYIMFKLHGLGRTKKLVGEFYGTRITQCWRSLCVSDSMETVTKKCNFCRINDY